jgi:hypothetical protein
VRTLSSAVVLIAMISSAVGCKPPGAGSGVMGGMERSGPGQETQNDNGNGSSLPSDPDWKMANWRKELCRCAGHEKDPDPRKGNYIKGLCYTEVNSEYDNRGICAKQCTEIMDRAGGKGAQGCRNASDPSDPSDSSTGSGSSSSGSSSSGGSNSNGSKIGSGSNGTGSNGTGSNGSCNTGSNGSGGNGKNGSCNNGSNGGSSSGGNGPEVQR